MVLLRQAIEASSTLFNARVNLALIQPMFASTT